MSDENENNLPAPLPGKDPANGRFVKGNKLGTGGNVWKAQLQALRGQVFASVTPDDLRLIVMKLVEKAKRGDIHAAKIIFDVTGLNVKQIEASVTAVEITAEEAQTRLASFFCISGGESTE